MKRLMNKLHNAQCKYDGVVGNVEAEIVDKIDFEFSILHHESDGWVMLAFDDHNAALEPLLKIIKKKGVLNEDDYMKYSI